MNTERMELVSYQRIFLEFRICAPIGAFRQAKDSIGAKIFATKPNS